MLAVDCASTKFRYRGRNQVVIKGRVTTYSQQSKYQLIVQKIEYEGEGTLLKF